jgi:hypothetical protein
MIVFFQNKQWECEIPHRLFQSLKTIHSSIVVKLQEVTQSNYKAITEAKVDELEEELVGVS